MKEYNKDFDIDFSPMSDETMSWLDELLMTCKRFHVDYYNASEKDRAFVEAVARKNYGLKQARNSGKPHLPLRRSLAFIVPAERIGFNCCGQCSTTSPDHSVWGFFVVIRQPGTASREFHFIGGCSFLGECDILGLVQRIQIVEETNVEDNKSMNVKKTVKSGITFGSALAMVISYTTWKSIGWAIFHGLLSWVYVIYFLLRY